MHHHIQNRNLIREGLEGECTGGGVERIGRIVDEKTDRLDVGIWILVLVKGGESTWRAAKGR